MSDKAVTAEQAREALLPCPHCGDGAALCTSPAIFAGQHYPDYPGQIHGYRIECAGNCHSMTCWWHTVDEARTAWNRRFIDQHSQPACMDEAVEKALSAFHDHRGPFAYLGESDEEGQMRAALTAAGLHALVAECERLRAEVAEIGSIVDELDVSKGTIAQCLREIRGEMTARIKAENDYHRLLAAAESRAEQAEAELEQARRTAEYWKDEHRAAGVVLEQAEARAESSEKDSARLRAVTAHGWRVAYASPGWCVFARDGKAIITQPASTYGAAIDAAIAIAQGGGTI